MVVMLIAICKAVSQQTGQNRGAQRRQICSEQSFIQEDVKW